MSDILGRILGALDLDWDELNDHEREGLTSVVDALAADLAAANQRAKTLREALRAIVDCPGSRPTEMKRIARDVLAGLPATEENDR